MKKNILLSFSLVALLCSSAFSQKDGFGLKLGANLANVGGDVEDNKMAISGHFGFYYNAMISDKFGLHPELVASAQGYKVDAGDETVPVMLLYLNIPILARYYVTESLNLEIGPQIGLLTVATVDGDSEVGEFKYKDFYKGTDFSLGIGANYELENGFNFGVRYNLGLSNITEEVEGVDDQPKVTNQVIQISVGMTFGS